MPRERKANFSIVEIRCMLEEISMHRYLVLSKEQSGPAVKAKREAWKLIANKVKEISSVERGHVDVKKKWNDLKTTVITYIKNRHQSGDCHQQEKPAFFDSVISIIRDNCHLNNGKVSSKSGPIKVTPAKVPVFQMTNGCSSSGNSTAADTDTIGEHSFTSKPTERPRDPSYFSSTITRNVQQQCKLDLSALDKKQGAVCECDEELAHRWLKSKIKVNEAKEAYFQQKMDLLKLNKYKLSLEVKKMEEVLRVERDEICDNAKMETDSAEESE